MIQKPESIKGRRLVGPMWYVGCDVCGGPECPLLLTGFERPPARSFLLTPDGAMFFFREEFALAEDMAVSHTGIRLLREVGRIYLAEDRQRDVHDAKVTRQVGTREHREGIASRFAKFNRANPAVFDRLAALVLEEHAAGARRLSIARAFEVLRHEGITTHGDRYELNNDYRRPYAELLEEIYPELLGLFEHRGRAERVDGPGVP